MKRLSQLLTILVLTCACALSTQAGDIPNDFTSPSDMGQPVASAGEMQHGISAGGNIPNVVTSPGIMLQPVISIGDISCGVTALMLAFTAGLS